MARQLPLELTFIRHGESEGNAANRRSRQGDHSAFTEAFRARHGSTWRLTATGREQAIIAGHWLCTNGYNQFDRYIVSTYYRAIETAALLGLLDARWYEDYYLRERDWGNLTVLPDNERLSRFKEAFRERRQDEFYWRPPHGESLAEVSLRLDRVLDTLARESSDGRVVVVCHGEVMKLFRVRMERIPQHQFEEATRKPAIQNCQILQYRRRDTAGKLHAHMVEMRSFCPWSLTETDLAWRPIKRVSYSNDDLLAICARATPSVEV
jgi:NAD+ kinase